MAPTIITTTPIPVAASEFEGGQPADLVSLADVKLELNITNNSSDAWLQKVITRQSVAASQYCNRILQPQLWKDRIWQDLDPYPWQVPPRLKPLQLSQWPITSTPSIAGTAPPLAPTLSSIGGGSLSTNFYWVRISYVAPDGETAASQESVLPVGANALLVVAPPIADNAQIATGWNVYVGTKSFGETQQNASPIGMNASWTLPTTGLASGGASPPNFMLVVENAPLAPTPLAEGIDFLVDAEHGQLTRLTQVNSYPRPWNLPVLAVYQAPYAEIPDDVQDAVILLVKSRWFARQRDPTIRQQNAEGIYSATYVMGTGPGGADDMSAEATAKLDRYRVPVIA